MAILSEQYEPQLDTIKLGDVYHITVKNGYNNRHEQTIHNIELLKGKRYPIDELCEIIQDKVEAKVTHDDNNIYVRRRYVLRKHAHLNTDITIHYSGVMGLQMPTGKLVYMDFKPNAIITGPKMSEKFNRMVQGNYYGSIKHRGGINI